MVIKESELSSLKNFIQSITKKFRLDAFGCSARVSGQNPFCPTSNSAGTED
jgi:hypothetical protein